jgi:hypothetical protein
MGVGEYPQLPADERGLMAALAKPFEGPAGGGANASPGASHGRSQCPGRCASLARPMPRS